MANGEIGWLEWDLDMLKVFLKSAPLQYSFSKDFEREYARDPEGYADLAKRRAAVSRDYPAEYRKRIRDIQRRIEDENRRLDALPPDERDAEYLQQWQEMVRKAEQFIEANKLNLG